MERKVGTMGYIEHALGKAGEVATFGLAGTAMADTLARGFGMKDGIVKPAFNKMANFVDPEGSIRNKFSGNSSDDAPDKSSQHNNSQPTNGSESQQNKSVHEKTPRTTNYAGQPTENHPINQSDSKGILSKFGEMFKSPKMEKLSEIAPKFFDKKKRFIK